MADQIHALMAIGPVDGRYAEKTAPLQVLLSEYGLIKHRLLVMTEYVIALSEHGVCRKLTARDIALIRSFADITPTDALEIKKIERATNHDVKACERYLRGWFERTGVKDLTEMIHFGLTSEDVNNCAYAIMLQKASMVLRRELDGILHIIDRLAAKYAGLAMLSRTHGQPATPTTLGKELKVFHARLHGRVEQIFNFSIAAKLNSASGNYNALSATFPDVAWQKFAEDFIRQLERAGGCNLTMNHFTTQIEPHDTYVELFDRYHLVNTILLDFVQDIWRYISDGWIVQKPKEGEVGSSIMPHKINPIDFENAEGNLQVANALLEFFGRKLPVSRLQRDLSDSTVERTFGTAFGHMLIAYLAIEKGLGKISANEARITAELENRWEVLTEYYQTILRREGYPDPYEALKAFARGKEITKEDCMTFIDNLDIKDEVKKEMRRMTPLAYTGLAERIVHC